MIKYSNIYLQPFIVYFTFSGRYFRDICFLSFFHLSLSLSLSLSLDVVISLFVWREAEGHRIADRWDGRGKGMKERTNEQSSKVKIETEG